ncbi:MAG: D-lyxose/D-mannose family sugar isomerase [Clostridia bacterium]|nr:D-lyxose/D-mannose family sugar isomerase [Clostridia bacterium]
MKRADAERQKKLAIEYYEKANIVLTDKEKEEIEVADFGLDMVDRIGLQLVVYINTERVCAKEMVLTPYQVCPEHRHVDTNGQQGKEETFRCRYGKVYLYTDCGAGKAEDVSIPLPPTDTTVFSETVLLPGEQFTIMPGTLHWFAAGEEGAVISEFSTRSTDETDYFTDRRIVRAPSVDE